MTRPCPNPGDLSAYLDGELAPGVRARLDTHLASCPSCAWAIAELRALHAEFRALPDESPGFDVAQVIRGRIEALPPRAAPRQAWGWRHLLPAGIGAAASVSLGLALGMGLTAPVVVAPVASPLEVFAPIAPGGLCPGFGSCWRPRAPTYP